MPTKKGAMGLPDLPNALGEDKAFQVLKKMHTSRGAGAAIVGPVRGGKVKIISAQTLSDHRCYNVKIKDLPDHLFKEVHLGFIAKIAPVKYCRCQNGHSVEKRPGVNNSPCREAFCNGTYHCS